MTKSKQEPLLTRGFGIGGYDPFDDQSISFIGQCTGRAGGLPRNYRLSQRIASGADILGTLQMPNVVNGHAPKNKKR